MKKILLLFGTAVLFLLVSNQLRAINKEIIINEIAWMGTINSANDEWIELKNITDQNIELSGWSIKSSDGKIKINLTGQINPGEFYLLERTDDLSLPDIKANLIYKGALNNSGINLGLYNNSDLIVDNLDYSSGWPAGDNNTKQTMERTSNNWQTSQSPNGTPGKENSLGIIKKEVKSSRSQEKILTEPEKTDNKKSVVTAAIIENKNNKDNTSLIIFLVSAFLVLLSAVIILFIKFKKKEI